MAPLVTWLITLSLAVLSGRGFTLLPCTGSPPSLQYKTKVRMLWAHVHNSFLDVSPGVSFPTYSCGFQPCSCVLKERCIAAFCIFLFLCVCVCVSLCVSLCVRACRACVRSCMSVCVHVSVVCQCMRLCPCASLACVRACVCMSVCVHASLSVSVHLCQCLRVHVFVCV